MQRRCNKTDNKQAIRIHQQTKSTVLLILPSPFSHDKPQNRH